MDFQIKKETLSQKNNHRQSVLLTIIEIGRHGREFAFDFLCELCTYDIYVCYMLGAVVHSLQKMVVHLKPILRVPLSKKDQRCLVLMILFLESRYLAPSLALAVLLNVPRALEMFPSLPPELR